MTTPETPTAQQLAHNDQILAETNRRIDVLIGVHRTVLADGDMHPQVALAGFAGYLEKHSDAASLAQFLAVAIDRIARDCDCGLDGEWISCCYGAIYGPCEYETCGGVCEYKGQCTCACHAEPAETREGA